MNTVPDGAPLFGAAHYKTFPGDHLAFCRFARAAGFHLVEVKYEARMDADGRLSEAAADLRRLVQGNGLVVSVHACYEDTNVGSLQERIRAASEAAYIDCVHYAAAIGARYLTVHGGDIRRDAYTPDLFAEVKACTIQSLRAVVAVARLRGITVCIENRHNFPDEKVRYPVRPADLLECAQALGDNVRFTVDSGHAHSLREEISLVDFIRAVGPARVALTHLHDNDGRSDQHLPPGDGTVDFGALATAWLTEGWRFPLMFEVKGEENFRLSMQRFRSLLGPGGRWR